MLKTEMDLKTMAEKALFLKERLQGDTNKFYFEKDNDHEQSILKKYQLWQKKAGGNGGEQAFLKRLAAEDLTPEQAKAILRPVNWKEGALFPPWVKEIEEMLAILPLPVSSLKDKLQFPSTEQSFHNKIDLFHALLPFVYYGEQQALSKLGANISFFTDEAMSDMMKVLTKSLNQLCYKTCAFEFQLYIQEKNPFFIITGSLMSLEEKLAEWNTFIEQLLLGKWRDVLTKYPVLARLISLTITNWTNNLVEFAQHLRADQRELESTFNDGNRFGKVTRIEADVSDVHNKGKSVFILTFSSGVKIVYKPRSLAIDRAWTKWVHYMEQNGLPYHLITPKVMDRNEYGWMEFIEHKPLSKKADVNAFYFRAGVLLGTVYAFGGNDFHYENIIACGAHPILVDTETLLLHKVKPFDWDENGASASQIANDVLNDSVLRTGMLPMWRTNKKGEAMDWGALTGKGEGKQNLPIYDGELLDVKAYEDQLIRGVEWVFTLIRKNSEQLLADDSPVLDIFGDCLFRFLIRNSQIYGDVLEHTAKPEFLQDGLLFSLEIERMAAAYLLSAPDESLKDLWNIFVSERDALEERDIPIFYGKARELTVRDGTKLLHSGYFMESAIDNAKNLMKKMDKKDQIFQIDLIKTSLSMHENSSHSVGETTAPKVANKTELIVTDELLLSEALRIYDEIMKRRITGQTDDFTWIVRQFDLQTEKMTLGQINFSLYDGVIGIGTFMSALYRVTKKTEIKETALSAIETFRKSLHASFNPLPIHRLPLGLGSGLAGMIRGLMVMGEYLEEDSLIDDAVKIAKSIQRKQIDQDKQLDILGGSAGLLTVLIDLYKQTGDGELLELAKHCGEHLLKQRVETETGHKMWMIGIEKQPLTGLGHGAAGYASALHQLATVTKEEAFKEAALEALAYENSLYEPEYKNWPDLRKNPFEKDSNKKAFMMGWCSGAPGVGLARMNMLESNSEQVIGQDIEKAVQFTRSLKQELSDHICCGHAGGIDLLIEASLLRNRPDLLEEARERMGMVIGRMQHNGHYLLNGSDHGAIFNPSFFQGISGIGYQLLRCIAPDEIKSLLK